MAWTELLSTSRVAAEATVDRLQELGIDAQVLDSPNVFVRATSGGNYRVRVGVPEEDLVRAREELARWAAEAEPRLRPLVRQVGRSLLVATLPCLVVVLYLFTRDPVPSWGPFAVLGSVIASFGAWVLWSRAQARGAAGARSEDP